MIRGQVEGLRIGPVPPYTSSWTASRGGCELVIYFSCNFSKYLYFFFWEVFFFWVLGALETSNLQGIFFFCLTWGFGVSKKTFGIIIHCGKVCRV